MTQTRRGHCGSRALLSEEVIRPQNRENNKLT
jgi:hypothetical protein